MNGEISDNKDRKLEEKTEKDYSEYRLKRLLEILLEADLKRLTELCQAEKNDKIPSSLKNKLTDRV
ncbi:MAG: hypothetical protein KKA59_05320 [Candidatus Omnitrophica bacterium]|nr:hypothetical protein [Candidatus Omnitrophota bacterium]